MIGFGRDRAAGPVRLGATRRAMARAERLRARGHQDQALTVLEELLAHGVDNPVADALVRLDRAAVLLELDRPEQALTGFDELLARHDPGSLEPGELYIVAFSAGFERAELLAGLGQFSEALAGFARLIELDTRHHVGALVDVLWAAKLRHAAMLGALGHPDQALTAYREVLEHPRGVFDRGPEPEHLILAGLDAATLLAELGRPRQALETYDQLLAEHGGDRAENWQLALARMRRGGLLAALGRTAEAVTGYQELLTRHDDVLTPRARHPGLIDSQRRQVVLETALALGDLFAEHDRVEEALATYATIPNSHAGAPADWLRELAATALRRSSDLLEGLGRHRDALDALDRADKLLLPS